MPILIQTALGFEIVENQAVIAVWRLGEGKSCGSDFARVLVEGFSGRSLPHRWVENYLEDPEKAVFGGGNWLIPTVDGKLMHCDGSISQDDTYEPVSLTEAVLDIIGMIRNTVLAA